MTGIEKGIFQADEYQLPAMSRLSVISITDAKNSIFRHLKCQSDGVILLFCFWLDQVESMGNVLPLDASKFRLWAKMMHR
jgi:hypothetical protein